MMVAARSNNFELRKTVSILENKKIYDLKDLRGSYSSVGDISNDRVTRTEDFCGIAK
jgi:hypothetical protein